MAVESSDVIQGGMTGPRRPAGSPASGDGIGDARPLSICLFADVALPVVGGAQTVLDALARQLLSLGHRPVIVAPAPRWTWSDDVFPYRVERHRRLRSKRIGTRILLPRLLRLHRRHRFDLVHCHSAYPPAHVSRTLRRLTGLPYVVRPHGADILPGEAIRSSWWLEKRMLSALRAADAVVAQGAFLRDVVLDCGIPAGRVHVIHNGVDGSAFAASAPHPHPRPYVLGLGSLVPHKGFDLLVRAFARGVPDDVDLLIAGEGPERDSLRRLADDLGLADRVHLLGNVMGESKVSLYRSAAVFVCPSRREPFANVILEAFASGLPVVATDVGGNRELLGDGAGILCRPDDPASLAEGVGRVLREPDLAEGLRRGAAETAARHAWRRVARRYVEVYRSVLADQR
jgi:glycosyltransferase involved in cell wall biosynthesis